MNQREDYGACCICESEGADVRNLIQLDYKVKSESGCGCRRCGLAAEGAVAVVCDGCMEPELDTHAIRFLMDGRQNRMPVQPVYDRIPHEHNLLLHPEIMKRYNGRCQTFQERRSRPGREADG